MRTTTTAALALAAALASAVPARAAEDGAPPAIEASLRLDGAVLAGALAAAGLATLLPERAAPARARELLPADEPAKRNFSASAARASDLLVSLTVLTPLALQAGQGLDGPAGDRALVYGETLALSLAVGGVTKALAARPRPFTYNPDPRVQAYADREGRDARRSFYSGHAATAFAAAVAGGYLFARSSDDRTARTAAWATGLFLAGATANLRVRAGKHFPSDVLVGAAAGAALGWAVPALHDRGSRAPGLAASEWVAIAAAPIAGAIVSQLVPMPTDITEPLAARTAARPRSLLVPWVSGHGAGLALVGALR
jgi:hypothetical protein